MTEIRIPKPGDAIVEGTLAEWRVEEGQQVARGDVLYELETDKTSLEIEAPVPHVHLAETPDQRVGLLVDTHRQVAVAEHQAVIRLKDCVIRLDKMHGVLLVLV